MDEDYVDVLIAMFWGAFACAAGMPFAGDCVQVAKDKRYYDTIRKNAEKFKTHPDEREAARRCCLRTGHLAAELAIHDQRAEISAKDFATASDEVEGRIDRVRQRAAANGQDSIQAGVCAVIVAAG